MCTINGMTFRVPPCMLTGQACAGLGEGQLLTYHLVRLVSEKTTERIN